MTPEEFARHTWQSDGATPALPPIRQLRARADKFRRKILRRNLVEYSAGALVIVLSLAMVVLIPVTAIKLGAALLFVGVGIVMWQLHHRGAPLSPATDGGQLSVLDYQRRELVRQRDAIDSVFWWYLLPMMPGTFILAAAPYLSVAMADWQWPPADVWRAYLFIAVVFVGVYLLNKWGARNLQREIDAIDALRG